MTLRSVEMMSIVSTSTLLPWPTTKWEPARRIMRQASAPAPRSPKSTTTSALLPPVTSSTRSTWPPWR